MDTTDDVPDFDEPEPQQLDEDDDDERPQVDTGLIAEPPHPVNWNLLTDEEAEEEWAELDRWVSWLRHTYGLPAAVVPPFWHHHQELVWELSALHIHWLCAYDPDQNGSAPSGWHRDFADTRNRLREWVAASGTRLDRDRPTRQTSWPGEQPAEPVEETLIADRDSEFVEFVRADVARRQQVEEEFYATLARDNR
ncbi:hypothetical protein [Arthrobacter sp. 260]|uniref:hypothetical protein n=1 Tax=Arthrobacter sp. 260 TaxID=2735314 RepID=UPI001491D92E|nr:hypothetical protein [Arthrobacter sp. 260]NOJ60328.1 hypothetical protein [Arthrobacter sp. 260]